MAIALTKGAALGGSTLTLIKGALKIMAWTKLKTTVVTGAAVLLAAGATTVIVQHTSRYREKVRGDAVWSYVTKMGPIANNLSGGPVSRLHQTGAIRSENRQRMAGREQKAM